MLYPNTTKHILTHRAAYCNTREKTVAQKREKGGSKQGNRITEHYSLYILWLTAENVREGRRETLSEIQEARSDRLLHHSKKSSCHEQTREEEEREKIEIKGH
jgi:hypothetical protein